jgi:hypothetical protein
MHTFSYLKNQLNTTFCKNIKNQINGLKLKFGYLEIQIISINSKWHIFTLILSTNSQAILHCQLNFHFLPDAILVIVIIFIRFFKNGQPKFEIWIFQKPEAKLPWYCKFTSTQVRFNSQPTLKSIDTQNFDLGSFPFITLYMCLNSVSG